MRIVIKGTVQGVGFRPAVYRTAVSLGMNGTVWNDGSSVVVETDDCKNFVDALKKNLPPLAKIESVEMVDSEYCGKKGFSISESKSKSSDVSIPTDTAICDKCLEEIFSDGRRKNYAFTSCTDCGPRFTLLRSLPYDRKNTAMDEFPMCGKCKEEFESPEDRRFHHQTICCPDCGPEYYYSEVGEMDYLDPIKKFADSLNEGKIGIAKSWGGMHICCKLSEIERLREWYRREQKPFAIMAKNIDAAKKYCELTEKEEELLLSKNRPIVLAKKKKIDERISPGLDNVGIFLPYTGMQHILFSHLKEDVLIMTSANLPGEPMVLDDEEIKTLNAECYLLHDQKIINRADDSVVRAYGNKTQFIRKSRGFIPSYLDFGKKGNAVGIGAQENLSASVAKNGRIYSTQYIGNGESYGVTDYLETATDSLISMLGCVPETVAMDLHPGYANRSYGKALSEKFGCDLIEVQHHWAHAASLMAEYGKDEAVVIAIDGTGYGTDGNAWGGEVLYSTYKDFKRLAHLEYIPLLGSEKALYDLRRLKFAIDQINGTDTGIVKENEKEILAKMIPNSVKSSSMGRVLDALSFSLGICEKRTYDGEPAMKTEPYLAKGKHLEGFETRTENGEIKTAHLFSLIDGNHKKEDLAHSIVFEIVKEMCQNACDFAEKKGLDSVGISGGVSYSLPIVKMAEQCVEKRGLKLMVHDKVPNGDGGISVGQTAIALHHKS